MIIPYTIELNIPTTNYRDLTYVSHDNADHSFVSILQCL